MWCTSHELSNVMFDALKTWYLRKVVQLSSGNRTTWLGKVVWVKLSKITEVKWQKSVTPSISFKLEITQHLGNLVSRVKSSPSTSYADFVAISLLTSSVDTVVRQEDIYHLNKGCNEQFNSWPVRTGWTSYKSNLAHFCQTSTLEGEKQKVTEKWVLHQINEGSKLGCTAPLLCPQKRASSRPDWPRGESPSCSPSLLRSQSVHPVQQVIWMIL